MSIRLLLPFFFFIFFNTITLCCSQQQLPQAADGLLCSIIDCGQGTCVPSNTTLLKYDCECFTGWKQLPVVPFCGVPNCTVNLDCAPLQLPNMTPNITDPCSLAWCGDGTCVPDGIGHTCQCSEGTSNFLGLPALPCFKPCYLGADCSNVNLGAPTPPQTSTKSAAAPQSGPGAATNTACRKLQALTTIALSAILSTWV